ncbi:MAG: TldD/PmbA family protein [Balneolaceae bacterium]
MKRKEFLKIAGIGTAGVAFLPFINSETLAGGILGSEKKRLAEIALTAAKSAGASYADIRIGRYLNQYISSREQNITGITNTESFGFGIRVVANGTWGFASSNSLDETEIKRVANQAVLIAKANQSLQSEPVQLAPVQAYGEVDWATPIETNPFNISMGEKVDLLMNINAEAEKAGADFCSSNLFFVNEQKYFASTEGTFTNQDVYRCWPTFTVTSINKEEGGFETRNSLAQPIGMGYEYVKNFGLIEEAREAAEQAKEKHSAKSVDPGKYDLVLDPSHLFLTIHESVGHPLELDRVLGYEANYAGTSFATLDKWRNRDFEYGSEIVNFVADKNQKNALATVGYDDDGVKTKQWDLVRDGKLVNYQATRDQVHLIDQNESHGCCYADSWSSVPFQRMPNVSLEPGKEDKSVEQIISNTEDGIYIKGRGSYSIDQQRYNFQFGGQLYYEIKNGKITDTLRDVAYQSNTQEFWNSCEELGGPSTYELGGTFFDGKGQPSQVSAVSHGCPTTKFKDVNIINTGRKIS